MLHSQGMADTPDYTQDSRATVGDAQEGHIEFYDGRTVYYHPTRGMWITVSQGVANTHNTDYDREVQESVEVYVHHPATEDSDAWTEATCTYHHIIPMEMYVADNPTPTPRPETPEGYSRVWGNYTGHTPQWVIDYGTF